MSYIHAKRPESYELRWPAGKLQIGPATDPPIEDIYSTTLLSWKNALEELGEYVLATGQRVEENAETLDGGLLVRTPYPLHTHISVNTKRGVQLFHGGLVELATSQPLNNGASVTVSPGVGKLVIVAKAPGAGTPGYAGAVHVLGTSVDRNTWDESGGADDVLAFDGISTDGNSTDGNGVVTYDLQGAYITSMWFSGRAGNPDGGNVSIETSDADLNCNIDVYQCSFEQLNDDPNAIVTTVDFDGLQTNTNAWMSLYLYHVNVGDGDDRVTIQPFVEELTSAADYVADNRVRMRLGGLEEAVNGSRDGIFAVLALGPITNSWWEDVDFNIWVTTEPPT